MGYGPWGFEELDTTEHTHTHDVDSSILGTI